LLATRKKSLRRNLSRTARLIILYIIKYFPEKKAVAAAAAADIMYFTLGLVLYYIYYVYFYS
jgi:hypothetical protein